MARSYFHRFESDGKRFVIDEQTCFCFECDDISWDVLAYYPERTISAIKHELRDRHSPEEIDEVVGELEWLRSTKAILPAPKVEELQKQFTLNKDLHSLDLMLRSEVEDTTPQAQVPASPPSIWSRLRGKATGPDAPRQRLDNNWEQRIEAALKLLFARSGHDNTPTLHLWPDDALLQSAHAELATQITAQLQVAASTGKQLTLAVCRDAGLIDSAATSPLAGQQICVELAFRLDPNAEEDGLSEQAVAQRLQRLAALRCERPKDLGKFVGEKSAPDQSRIILRPGSCDFQAALTALLDTGLQHVALDLEGAYLALGQDEALALMGNLKAVAEDYAARLLKRENLRIEPLAGLFRQIYEGQAQLRGDPTGLQHLAIDAEGQLFPGRPFFAQPDFRCGDLNTGAFDAGRLGRFEDVGALTTPDCMRCWARSLCGGGYAAVHQAWRGDFRQPDTTWCDAQRRWLEAAIVAFNRLSAEGVNFTRVYDALQQPANTSVWKMLKAAWQTRIVPRPIHESDAAMLQSWENWNSAAYFLCNESGLLLATQYDREMDSLHPRSADQEYILTRRNGAPMGLLKISPSQVPVGLWIWIHFRDPADYANPAIQQSFRRIMDELTAKQKSSGATAPTLFTPVGPDDQGLDAFLEALGFTHAGVQQEALYLHGAYRDVRLFTLSLQ